MQRTLSALLLAVSPVVLAVLGMVWLWFNLPLLFWIAAGVAGLWLAWAAFMLWYVDRNPGTF